MAAPIHGMRSAVQGLAKDLEAAAVAVTTSGKAIRQAADEAEQHVGRIKSAATESQQAALTISASASEARQAADDAASHGGRSIAGLQQQVETAAAAISSSSAKVAKAAEDAARSVSQSVDDLEAQEPRVSRMDELLESFYDRGNAQIESLISRLRTFGDDWSPAIAAYLETLQVGVGSLEEFLRIFGDAVVETETGHERLRELLDDLDPDIYTRQIVEIVRALRDGQASIAQTIDFLRTKNSEYATSLADLVQAVLEGKATVEDLRRKAEQLEQLFPDSALADLTDELARQLAGGLV